jgi:predicted nucleic acid-binding protein
MEMEKIKVYLDNCSYNRPFDDQTDMRISLETQAKLWIQGFIKNGQVDLIWSYVNEYENYINPYDNRKLSIYQFSGNAKSCVLETREILLTANQIIKQKIKPLDALHLACAICAKVDCFITVDDRLLRYNANTIQIMDPIMFVKFWQSQT